MNEETTDNMLETRKGAFPKLTSIILCKRYALLKKEVNVLFYS